MRSTPVGAQSQQQQQQPQRKEKTIHPEDNVSPSLQKGA